MWLVWFPSHLNCGGDDGIRTHDPLLAGQVLSQLSYTPILIMVVLLISTFFLGKTNFSISIAFSISVRLLYSVFNDHLHLEVSLYPLQPLRFAKRMKPFRFQAMCCEVYEVNFNGRSGWSRTIDLAIISRVL